MKPPVLKTGTHTVGRGFESRPLRHLFTSKTDGIGELESGYLEPFPREYLASQEIAFGGAITPRCFVKLSISRGAKLANWHHIVPPQFEPCPSVFQASKLIQLTSVSDSWVIHALSSSSALSAVRSSASMTTEYFPCR